MTCVPGASVVRKQTVVEAPIEQAFEVFVRRFGKFKPEKHNLLTVPISETVFEPWVGGHIVDRGANGAECRWARVLAYDPPQQVIFSWDVNPSWQVEAEPCRASEVKVNFTAVALTSTRVDLEHCHLDRHGPGWEMMAYGVGHDQGWPLYLKRYANLIMGSD